MNEANAITMFVGIDVSKRKLDCAALLGGKIKSKVVSNDPAGFSSLNAWLKGVPFNADIAMKGVAVQDGI